MKVNRNQAPEIKSALQLNYILPEERIGKTGNRYFLFSGSDAATLRIEAIFAGTAYPEFNRAYTYAIDLLMRGTKNKTAHQIHSLTDLYGAFISTESTKDTASCMLFTLKKFLPKALPLFLELLEESIYPENEIELYRKSELNQLQINKQKTDFMANRGMQQLVFGAEHPYGRLLDESDHAAINREEIWNCYTNRLKGGGVLYFISGNISDAEFAEIDAILSHSAISQLKSLSTSIFEKPETELKEGHFVMPQSLQNSIRVSRLMQINSPAEMAIASLSNVVLGGYFGSRLMSNLREKNGYTYGVGSGYQTLRFTHMWNIRTEVGSDMSNDALREIFSEIAKLQEEKVGEEELLRVKRYVSGNLLNKFENIHSLPVALKPILMRGENADYYQKMAAHIHEVKAEDILLFAQNNWNKNELYTYIAGK